MGRPNVEQDTDHVKSRHHDIHWRVPTTMLGALLLGIIFALGHHLFYSTLAGTVTSINNYCLVGMALSNQEVNTGVGTAFAFMVKASLTLSVSVAYVQVVWISIRKKANTVRSMDTIFSVLGKVSSLVDLFVWFRYPMLATLVLVVWLLPIAAIVAPATLTVRMQQAPNTFAIMQVPRVDFTSLNFFDLYNAVYSEDANEIVYPGPQASVKNTFAATVAQGLLLPTAPAYNSSWDLTFPGPAIQCGNVSQRLRAQIENNVLGYWEAGRRDKFVCPLFGYLGWVPESGGSELPLSQPLGLSNATLPGLPYETLDRRPQQPATFFVATFPNVAAASECTPADWTGSSSILQCQLYNTSYEATFKSINGARSVDMRTSQSYNDVAAISGIEFTDNSTTAINVKEVETLAYQSIMDTFGQTLVGVIVTALPTARDQPTDYNTSILSTALSQTPQLAFLRPDPSLSVQEATKGTLSWKGLSTVQYVPPTTEQLGLALEQLFQNATMSLMTNPLLQPNYSSLYAPDLTNVTFSNYHNVYIYSASKLWLAYGSAILASAAAVVAGLLALRANGVSYTDSFSTALRTTRNAELTVSIHRLDIGGHDPLPRYLADAEVTFRNIDVEVAGRGTAEQGGVDENSVESRESNATLPLLDDDGGPE